MIESESDFALVNVNPFKAFFDEFESYPARADAADGMPYDSLSDLDGLLDPPLTCLDPAWLTELVREIDWFMQNGFTVEDPYAPILDGVLDGAVHASAIPGSRQPPVVLKAFLEDACEPVRGWAGRWDKPDDGDGVAVVNRSAVLKEGAFPEEWTSLGAFRLESPHFSLVARSSGSDQPGFPSPVPLWLWDWQRSSGGEEPNISLALKKIFAKAAERDFLSIRLFDHEEPDDDPAVPVFSWKKADVSGDHDRIGVDPRYMSRQLLALHSDCEKIQERDLFVRLGTLAGDGGYEIEDFGTDSWSNPGWYTVSHGSHTCETFRRGEPTSTTRDYYYIHKYNVSSARLYNWSSKVLLPVPTYGPMLLSHYSIIEPYHGVPFRYDWREVVSQVSKMTYFCDHGDYATTHVSDHISFEGYNDHTLGRLVKPPPAKAFSWKCKLPDFIEVSDVRVVLLAASWNIDESRTTENIVTSSQGDWSTYWTREGTSAMEMFVAAVPAEYDGERLTVREIPDIPEPSGNAINVEIPPEHVADYPSDGRPSGDMEDIITEDIKVDSAAVLSCLGAIVKAKFRASVKER